MNIELNLEYDAAIATAIPVSDEEWQTYFATWAERIPSLLTEPLSHHGNDLGYEVTLRITDDAAIQQLNAQYRRQDRPTDVLSFAALETDFPAIPDMEPEPTYLGDIVISLPTAIAQAQERGHSTRWELLWLAAHGFLHLLGWDHPDDRSLESMLEQQELLLATLPL